MGKQKLSMFLFFVCFFMQVNAQNNRINTYQNIGWYNYFGTLKINKKLGVHTEYQWRRNNFITHWQQGLLRLGINYKLKPSVLLRFGYAWIETFPYGKISINTLGRNFTEHRLFQMVQLSHKENKIDVSHRFMLEQRFVGRYSSLLVSKEDEFPLLNRLRYMLRLQLPLKENEIGDKVLYIAVYNEIFIGFGKNVNVNVFDQNRLGVLMGYSISKTIKLEAGYLNQILQFGRLINGQNVFQNNKGIIINANFNFDFVKVISN